MARRWSRISDRLRVYRSIENSWVAGVCAGLAQRLGIAPIWLRAGFVLAVVLMNNNTTPMFIYFGLAFLLQPQGYARGTQAGVEKAFSGLTETITSPFSVRPARQLAALQARFAALEARIVRAEMAVTSPDVELRRQFRDLGA